MTKKTYYITTAIDYVNAKPHVGHAFEKVVTDVIARWNRLQGKDVFFLTGVDENAQKNVEAAKKSGIPIKEFVDKNTAFFLQLCKNLNISYDDFIRTSADEHAKVVQRILQKIIENGDIYKGVYEGLYCIGCETYYTEKDLVDKKCPEHLTPPQLRKEEAYFFKLSKYSNQLLKLIPKYVSPKSKANEIINRIKEGLNDISITRKGVDWGVPFPSDKDFKVWVWVDALINYVSGLKNKEDQYWPANLHVIGKGINWFHSVIWPSILLAADYPLPKKLLVHGYLNTGGKKISKSLGNTIDPLELLNKYSSDSVRYSLLRNTVFDDSDYSEEILIQRHNDELANKLGNLVSRVSTLAEKYGIEKTKSSLNSAPLLKNVDELINNYETDRAISQIFAFIDKTNEYIQSKKPWETKDSKVLYELSNAIKDIAILLSPFLPESSQKISKSFNFKISLNQLNTPLQNTKIKKAPILFQKIK
jgi:methionyl-tRNA synthetase